MNKNRFLTVLFLFLSFAFPAAWGDGMFTPFTDVLGYEVPVGRSQAVEGGLIIDNSGNTPLRVTVDVLIPSKRQLRKGAIPIPDTQWITVQPNEAVIPAHSNVRLNVAFLIPDQ